MLVDGTRWFSLVPGVTDTGSLNLHFVGDVGLAYLVGGCGQLYALYDSLRGLPVLVLAVSFQVLHALWHLFEIAIGRMPFYHLWLDFPAVFLPSILLVVIAMKIDFTPSPATASGAAAAYTELPTTAATATARHARRMS